jgi:hypothetical protein
VVGSVLARHDNGKQYFSLSRLGSQAGAAFLSRTCQPSTNNTAGDGAESFGLPPALALCFFFTLSATPGRYHCVLTGRHAALAEFFKNPGAADLLADHGGLLALLDHG